VPTCAQRDRAAAARLPVGSGLRDRSEIALVMPLPAPVPPSPAASQSLRGGFAGRGIEWHPSRMVTELDPFRKVAVSEDGSEMPFDLFLGGPSTRCPQWSRRQGCASTPSGRARVRCRRPGRR
jgi:sulfide:quinone oxidoreductase